MAWIDPCNLLRAADPQRLIAHAPALTHSQWLQQSLTLAAFLHGAGTRRAVLWFSDAAELAGALFACWRAGVVAALPGDLQQARRVGLDEHADLWLSDAPLPAMSVPQHQVAALREHFTGAPLPPAPLDPDFAGVQLL
ncbi:MAG: AMP-binding protein, partial [Pseudomonadales bacterium]|nr:AMP-binding protein [Pseudomonadales bacterium]